MQAIINKEARASYEFLDAWDAGIVLTGAEVKSVKKGQMRLQSAYVSFENSELWLKNAHIAAYQRANQTGYDPERPRKILLTKKELTSLGGKLHEKGLTLVPEKVYSNGGLIKIRIVLARGLKKHDKRAKIKERDVNRTIARALKNDY